MYLRHGGLAGALLLITACSGDENVATCLDDSSQLGCAPIQNGSTSRQVIRIGLVAPLTGGSSASGEGLKNGATLAFREIDWTIGDYRVELVDIDSESANLDSQAIAAKYRTAIQTNDLVAGLLNWHSSVAVELMDVAADEQMAHLFPLGATDQINTKYAADPTRYRVWSAKGWPQPGTYVKSYLDLMQCLLTSGCQDAEGSKAWSPSNRAVYVATEAGSWGDAFEAGATSNIVAATSWWAQNGWRVAGSLELSATDDATQLSDKAQQVADAGVSVVLMTSTADNMGQFVEQLRLKMDPDPVIIVEGLGWSAASLTSAGQSAIGVLDGGFGPYSGDPARATVVQRFQEQYELQFGQAPSTSSGGLAYDYTRFAIRVLERVLETRGTIDREGILEVYAQEVRTGMLTFDDGVVMDRYSYTETTAPDPVYGIGDYYFPVYQYQDPNQDGTVDFATVFPSVLRDANVLIP